MKVPYKAIGKNVAVFFISLAVLSGVVFFAASYAPGDPLQSYYGDAVDQMSTAQYEAARHRWGLDQPVYKQYFQWVDRSLHGEMGMSLKYREPASRVIHDFVGNTLFLGIVSYILIFIFAIVVAVCCVLYEGRWLDTLLSETGTILFYLPAFWVGLLLILIFNVNLGWLPGSGAYDPGEAGNWGSRAEHIVLPVIVMLISHVWYYAYMIRNKLLDETRKDYVLLAKMKGLGRLKIVLSHCLRNVAPTIFSVMAIGVNHIVGGTYVVEAVFAYPGLGNLAVESAKYHDYNVLILVVLLTGAVVIAAGLAAQAVSARLDKRMKTEGGTAWTKTNGHLPS